LAYASALETGLGDEKLFLSKAEEMAELLASRWDDSLCGGGLKADSFDRKNLADQAAYLALLARLYRFTGNVTYLETATEMQTWLTHSALLKSGPEPYIEIESTNSKTVDDCKASTNAPKISANSGLLVIAYAHLWNATSDPVWDHALENVWSIASDEFFENGVVLEKACEPKICDGEIRGRKAILVKAMGVWDRLVPKATGKVVELLKKSASKAVESCDGGCTEAWEGFGGEKLKEEGVGEVLAALEAVQGLLPLELKKREKVEADVEEVQTEGEDESGARRTEVAVWGAVLMAAGTFVGIW
jgi:mannan endo-1,6-alpha-mannosidase